MESSSLEIKYVDINKLKPFEKNPRKHPQTAKDKVKRSIQEFGWTNPILVNKKGLIIAGHLRFEVATELGMETVPVVVLPFTMDQSTLYNIADNRIAEDSEWDWKVLQELLTELKTEELDLDLSGFDFKEINNIFNGVNYYGEPFVEPQEAIEDEIPELPEEPITKPGYLWLLGKHRLLCGDATKMEDITILMDGNLGHLVVTDPPYGVDYDGGRSNKTKRETLIGDKTTELYRPCCKMSAQFTDKSAPLYLFHAGIKGHAAAAAAAAAAAGYVIRSELIWHKLKAHYGAFTAQYKQKHEPLFYCYKKNKTPRWHGPTNEITVWEYDQPSRNEYHPTEKPICLIARPIKNSSKSGHIVCDWFSGSGTTIIAAEQLNRKCYAMEIDPRYCDVAVKRWENFTGKKAKLVQE